MLPRVASAVVLVLALAGCQEAPVRGAAGDAGGEPDAALRGISVGPAAEPTCAVPASVQAHQVLVVSSIGARARVTACARTTKGGYTSALGPFTGHVGRNGVAAPGA